MDKSTFIFTSIAVVSAVGTTVNNIVQSRKFNSERENLEINITQRLQIVYNGIFKVMQGRIDELEREIKEFKKDEGKWKKLFYKMVVILEQNACRIKCPIREKVNELLSEENTEE